VHPWGTRATGRHFKNQAAHAGHINASRSKGLKLHTISSLFIDALLAAADHWQGQQHPMKRRMPWLRTAGGSIALQSHAAGL